MPPPAAPKSRCFGSFGSTAIAATRPITSTSLLPYVCPLGMSDGPMACQGGGAVGAATLALRRVVRALRRRIVSAVAALASAAAKDFAAGAALRGRPALAPLTGFARKAFFVSPNFGRGAFGGAIFATTSSLSL